MAKKEFIVDGEKFSSLAETADAFTKALGFTENWNGNLDAFNDMLCGGYGTPDEGFVLIWRKSNLSREYLGFKETLRWLEQHVRTCHPSNIPEFQARIAAAQKSEGETLFDMLIEIIREHKKVELQLQ